MPGITVRCEDVLCMIPVLYRLCDSDIEVRQSAVTVLTHLILNDMIKVKGQLSAMALCLEDPVSKIIDRVKLFFLELSKKVTCTSINVHVVCCTQQKTAILKM